MTFSQIMNATNNVNKSKENKNKYASKHIMISLPYVQKLPSQNVLTSLSDINRKVLKKQPTSFVQLLTNKQSSRTQKRVMMFLLRRIGSVIQCWHLFDTPLKVRVMYCFTGKTSVTQSWHLCIPPLKIQLLYCFTDPGETVLLPQYRSTCLLLRPAFCKYLQPEGLLFNSRARIAPKFQ